MKRFERIDIDKKERFNILPQAIYHLGISKSSLLGNAGNLACGSA